MTVEDRLLILLSQARRDGGDAALRDTSMLRSRLSSQAPDLHGEIQAMAAALAMGAPGRITDAADAEAERSAIAAEIAMNERLSASVVRPGLDVACQGGADITPAAVDVTAWAGDSMVVGAGAPPPTPPHPAPQPFAPQPPQPGPGGYGAPYYPPAPGPYGPGVPPLSPFYTQTWFFVLIAGIVIAGAVGYTLWRNWSGSSPAATAQTTPPGNQPQPIPPPPVNGPIPGGPVLSTNADALPALPLRMINGRYNIGFRVVTEGGPIDGAVLLPAGGWDGETAIVGTNGAGARAAGGGRLQRAQAEQGAAPVRSMVVRWAQDGVGAGDTQVVFIGQEGQGDVTLAGSTMCLTDGTGDQVVGCGAVTR